MCQTRPVHGRRECGFQLLRLQDFPLSFGSNHSSPARMGPTDSIRNPDVANHVNRELIHERVHQKRPALSSATNVSKGTYIHRDLT